MSFIVTNPAFINTACDVVRVTLEREDGVKTVAEFKVPDNQERDVNHYWDYILDNFDIEEMREKRRQVERQYAEEQKYIKQKNEAATEAFKLRDLFNLKMAVFNYPFVKTASEQEKTAIRRAQDMFILSAIVNKIASEYMEKNNLSMLDLLDVIDDDMDDVE